MTSQGPEFFDLILERIETLIKVLVFATEKSTIGNTEDTIDRIKEETIPKLTTMMAMIEFNGVIFRRDLEYLCDLERVCY